jgi:DHA1 family multidrug resistance protein-like MFS transporter
MFMSFAYGCALSLDDPIRARRSRRLIYLSFAAWPLVFEGVYGLAPGASGLPFLSILVGAIISVPVSLLFQRQYLAATLAAGDGKPEPENRLPPAVWGGLSIGVSFLWFGWSSYTGRVHILVPTASGALLGLGNVLVFRCVVQGVYGETSLLMVPHRSLQTFLIDVFQDFSASAQSANVIVRSAFGAAFRASRHGVVGTRPDARSQLSSHEPCSTR